MNRLKIIIVEDDPILCDLLRIRLTKMGHLVTGMYATGEEATKAISKAPTDLVIMDVTLVGNIDGIETAQQIQVNHPIPIVFLTGSSDPQTFERAKLTENSEYILKPFSDSDLYIAIEMATQKFYLQRKTGDKQKFLENIFKFAGVGIITTDPEGTIIIANPVAESVTGFQFNSSKKTHFSEMVNITDENGYKFESPVDAIRADLVTRDLPENTILVAADGTKMHIRGTVTHLNGNDGNGQFKGIIFTFAPLTIQNSLGLYSPAKI